MHRTNRILGLEILKDTRSWIKGYRTPRGLIELTNRDQIKRQQRLDGKDNEIVGGIKLFPRESKNQH